MPSYAISYLCYRNDLNISNSYYMAQIIFVICNLLIYPEYLEYLE